MSMSDYCLHEINDVLVLPIFHTPYFPPILLFIFPFFFLL